MAGTLGNRVLGVPVASLSVSGYNRDSSQQDLFTMTLLENNGNVSLRFYSGFFAYHLQNYFGQCKNVKFRNPVNILSQVFLDSIQ